MTTTLLSLLLQCGAMSHCVETSFSQRRKERYVENLSFAVVASLREIVSCKAATLNAFLRVCRERTNSCKLLQHVNDFLEFRGLVEEKIGT